MGCALPKLLVVIAAQMLVFAVGAAFAATEDLGNGFRHHGVATPVSNHRGTVATADGEGRNVVLVWLFDHRGGYALLMIDAETGESEEIPMPFPPGGDCPFSAILSSRNKYYTHFNGYFCEFDPEKREFTFSAKTAPRVAMGMTEDDNGVIWAVTYPNSGVLSFDPETQEFKDYGYVHDENWAQYQRYVAADDSGWIYFGIGSTNSHIIAFDPATGTAKPMIPDVERRKGAGYVYRDVNGKVYGHPGNSEDGWYEFYQGEGTKIGKHEEINKKPIITSHQGLFHRAFPDGKVLKRCDTVERILVVEDPASGESKQVSFDYTSEGAHMMGMAAGPTGAIIGGTAFPMRCFIYDPETDELTNRGSYGQWNTVVTQGDRFFVGGYGGGFLLEYDPAEDWVATVKGQEGCNPLFLTQCSPTIHRPHDLLAHPDGKTIVLAGTPGYGYTGGGLLFWDLETKSEIVIEHTDILLEHSTMSLVALPDGKLLAGTTTSPGTGGERKAEQAELYIMDIATKQVEWHEVVFPGVQSYLDMILAPNGIALGVADSTRFFAFDPAERKIVHELDLDEAGLGSTCSGQQPRVFVQAPDETIYILFRKGIAKVDPETFEITLLAESPVSISPGGAFLDGRIYFGSGSHVYSYGVPE